MPGMTDPLMYDVLVKVSLLTQDDSFFAPVPPVAHALCYDVAVMCGPEEVK